MGNTETMEVNGPSRRVNVKRKDSRNRDSNQPSAAALTHGCAQENKKLRRNVLDGADFVIVSQHLSGKYSLCRHQLDYEYAVIRAQFAKVTKRATSAFSGANACGTTYAIIIICVRMSDCRVSKDTCSIPCFKEKLVRKLQQKLPPDEVLEEARILFAALSDRARLKILIALQDDEELCVCDVAHVLGTTISTASHHLRKMRDLELLKYRNDGRMAYYSLRSELAGKLAADVLRAEVTI